MLLNHHSEAIINKMYEKKKNIERVFAILAVLDVRMNRIIPTKENTFLLKRKRVGMTQRFDIFYFFIYSVDIPAVYECLLWMVLLPLAVRDAIIPLCVCINSI